MSLIGNPAVYTSDGTDRLAAVILDEFDDGSVSLWLVHPGHVRQPTEPVARDDSGTTANTWAPASLTY